jgi:hypothetical protein
MARQDDRFTMFPGPRSARAIAALETFYRQLGVVGAHLAALETALGGPPTTVVLHAAQVVHAWAVLEAELDLATVLCDTAQPDREGDGLWSLPTMQELRRITVVSLRRCLATVSLWPLPTLVVQLEQLAARLASRDERRPTGQSAPVASTVLLVPIAGPPAPRDRRCGRARLRGAARPRSRLRGRMAS